MNLEFNGEKANMNYLATPAEYQEYIFRHDVEKASREELERLIERSP